MSGAYVVYVVVVAGITGLLAQRKRRSPGWWAVGGLLGGLPILILAALAPPAGEPWRSRAPLAIFVFLAILLVVVLVVVAISQSHFTY